MTYDNAIMALSNDAVKLVKNNQTIGLGSGRSATAFVKSLSCLLYTSPSPRDKRQSRMPSSA